MLAFYGCVLAAYLLGSLPFAVWIARRRGIVLSRVGDGNLGARNVFLQVGRPEGALAGLLDIAKGALPVIFGQRLGLDTLQLFIVGLLAILGHNWSVFNHFQGGQGMATTVGVFLALSPALVAIGILLIAACLAVTRNWDVACAIGLAWIPLAALLWQANPALAAYCVILLPLIWVRKRIVSAERLRDRQA